MICSLCSEVKDCFPCDDPSTIEIHKSSVQTKAAQLISHTNKFCVWVEICTAVLFIFKSDNNAQHQQPNVRRILSLVCVYEQVHCFIGCVCLCVTIIDLTDVLYLSMHVI